MKWFWRYLFNKLDRVGSDCEAVPISSSKHNRLISVTDDYPDGGLNIQVKSAIGGKIVIFRHYDQRTDRTNHTTYIINSDENFSESLGKIITTESLKL
jgi:hypothetical protein